MIAVDRGGKLKNCRKIYQRTESFRGSGSVQSANRSEKYLTKMKTQN